MIYRIYAHDKNEHTTTLNTAEYMDTLLQHIISEMDAFGL